LIKLFKEYLGQAGHTPLLIKYFGSINFFNHNTNICSKPTLVKYFQAHTCASNTNMVLNVTARSIYFCKNKEHSSRTVMNSVGCVWHQRKEIRIRRDASC